MINYEYQDLFAQGSVTKEYRIQVYSGETLESVITNTELYSESIELHQPLCTESMLRYGACESAYIKFTVVNTVGTLKGKKLIVKCRPLPDSTAPYLPIGEFYVDTDELADDRKSREITAYDKIQTIINTDIAKWYSECGLPLNLKDFRDSFFDYFGIEQEEVELVNDSMVITEVALPETISGLEVIQCICAGNGCLGRIDNEGKFKYVFLNDPDEQDYGRNYKSGTLIYEDYEVQQITALRFFSNNDMEIYVGEEGNEYVMEDNFLFYDKLESALEEYVTNIFNIIKETPKYHVLKVETYGDFCIEPGDMISFTSAEGDTLSTLVLQKTTTGLQALTDEFETIGTEYFEYDINSENSSIRRLWNNTVALQTQMESARTYVYAHRNVKRFNIGHTAETEIIKITIATVDDTIPIFLATIPLEMSLDGEIIFRYYVDGLQVENDTDRIYLAAGEQFVTLSTFFELTKNQRINFTVTAQTAYRESEDRKQEAKLISLKDWIDNQSITIDEETGEASFDYDYVETPVDTTPPGATIYLQKIRAMLFASGLAPTEPWDGTLLNVDEASVWTLEEIGFKSASDSVTINTQTPTGITGSDTVSMWNLEEITFAGAGEVLNVNMYTETYVRVNEDGETERITEDGLVRYTEGD